MYLCKSEDMKKIALHTILCLILFITGCSPENKPVLQQTGNAVYYWRTTFMLDSTECAYLHQYNIRTLYCRYFDVVMNELQGPMPNATLQFAQSFPDSLEVIPTVFIMNNCMQSKSLLNVDGKEDVTAFARRIVSRITQMNQTNDVKGVRQIQIDCDYTARNRELYYRFLKAVRHEAQRHGLGLSVTIRLHQLSMPAPPADYGVLMLYNTGAPERFSERNPILDLRDVQPYLPFLKDYPLPMGAAYPTFVWNRNIHGTLISHAADYADISRTKRLVEAERPDLRQLVVTYHLDNENIQRYTPQQHEEIYSH